MNEKQHTHDERVLYLTWIKLFLKKLNFILQIKVKIFGHLIMSKINKKNE